MGLRPPVMIWRRFVTLDVSDEGNETGDPVAA